VPEAVAFLFVYFPFFNAIELNFVTHRDSANGTVFRTDFAGITEGLDANVNRFV